MFVISMIRKFRLSNAQRMWLWVSISDFFLVAIPNTVVGLSIFPVLKAIFISGNNLIFLMSVSHILAVSFSFLSHSKLTFRSEMRSDQMDAILWFKFASAFDLLLC